MNLSRAFLLLSSRLTSRCLGAIRSCLNSSPHTPGHWPHYASLLPASSRLVWFHLIYLSPRIYSHLDTLSLARASSSHLASQLTLGVCLVLHCALTSHRLIIASPVVDRRPCRHLLPLLRPRPFIIFTAAPHSLPYTSRRCVYIVRPLPSLSSVSALLMYLCTSSLMNYM